MQFFKKIHTKTYCVSTLEYKYSYSVTGIQTTIMLILLNIQLLKIEQYYDLELTYSFRKSSQSTFVAKICRIVLYVAY